MQKNIALVLQTGEHTKRDELKQFLSGVAEVSDKIQLEERDTNGVLRSSISFLLEVDDSVASLVKGVKDELKFEVFISLSCHNCPDVVQALNQFALINPNISSEMIDGGLYQSLVEERDIQGVPM